MLYARSLSPFIIVMTNGISPFASNQDLEDFAEAFLTGRINQLRKDVGICLRKNKDQKHAYFPALMSCISFLDLLSGLHSGKLRYQGLTELISYMKSFVDPLQLQYDPPRLAIVYEAFRHKLAHLGHPYVVFDTSTMSDRTLNQFRVPQMRLAWMVCKRRKRYMPIEIRPQTGYLRKTLTPWKVGYDHRVFISIEHIRLDAIKSVIKPGGYLARLKGNQVAKAHFTRCMKEYYPT